VKDMNTFFHACVGFILLMLTFSLVANFVDGIGAFPHSAEIGPDIDSTDSALSTLTGLSSPSMNTIWLGVTGLTFLGAVALCYLTHSIVPIGLHLFSLVFWTSWIRMSSILSYGGYIPDNLILVFTVGVMFVFIAAIVGILTGSG